MPDALTAERALMERIERMIGRPPVGYGDTIRLLTHPDVRPLFLAWVELHDRETWR